MYDQPARASNTNPTSHRRLGVGVGAVLVLVAAAAVAHDSASSATPSADPGSPDAKPNPVGAPAVSTGSPRPSPSPTETAVLPDLAGKSLAQAREAARAAGFSLFTSHDATGRDRVKSIDGHWKVCTQNPLPGTHPALVEVEFSAVEHTEPCPH